MIQESYTEEPRWVIIRQQDRFYVQNPPHDDDVGSPNYKIEWVTFTPIIQYAYQFGESELKKATWIIDNVKDNCELISVKTVVSLMMVCYKKGMKTIQTEEDMGNGFARKKHIRKINYREP